MRHKMLRFILTFILVPSFTSTHFWTTTVLRAPKPVESRERDPFSIAMGGVAGTSSTWPLGPFVFFGEESEGKSGTSNPRKTRINIVCRSAYNTWAYYDTGDNVIIEDDGHNDTTKPHEAFAAAPSNSTPTAFLAYLYHKEKNNKVVETRAYDNDHSKINCSPGALEKGGSTISNTDAISAFPRVVANPSNNAIFCWQQYNNSNLGCPCSVWGRAVPGSGHTNLSSGLTGSNHGAPSAWINNNNDGVVAWDIQDQTAFGIAFYDKASNAWMPSQSIGNNASNKKVDVVLSEDANPTAIVLYQDNATKKLFAAYIEKVTGNITRVQVSNNEIFQTGGFDSAPLQIVTTKNKAFPIAMAAWVESDGSQQTIVTRTLSFDPAKPLGKIFTFTKLGLGFQHILNSTEDKPLNGTTFRSWVLSMDGKGNATLLYRNVSAHQDCGNYCHANQQWFRNDIGSSGNDSSSGGNDGERGQANNRRISSMNFDGNAVLCFTSWHGLGLSVADTRFNWLGDIKMVNPTTPFNEVDPITVTPMDQPTITPDVSCFVVTVESTVAQYLNRFPMQGDYFNIVSWDKSIGATGYNIYRGTDCDNLACGVKPFTRVGSGTCTFVDHDQSPTIPQQYCVTAINNFNTDECNHLTWAPVNKGGLTGYSIIRDSVEIATVDADTTEYDDCNIVPGFMYTYEIQPLPVDITQCNKITWDAVPDAAGYNIYRSQTGDGCPNPPDGCTETDCKLNDTPIECTENCEYIDCDVDLATCTYTYKVTVVNDASCDKCVKLNWCPVQDDDFFGADAVMAYNIYKDGVLLDTIARPAPAANTCGQYVCYTDCDLDGDDHNYNVVGVDTADGTGFETFPRTGVVAGKSACTN